MSQCNNCSLKSIRKGAKGTHRVLLSYLGANFGLGGVNVIMYPKDLKLPKKGTQARFDFEKEHLKAWFMEMGDHCEC